MAIRNYRELSSNLKLIVGRLLTNQKLCKLLRYNDYAPLEHDDFLDTKILLNDNIRIIPKLGVEETSQSRLVLMYTNATKTEDNNEVDEVLFHIFVYTPINEWIINGDDLRPFLIMSEIEESLNGKVIDGIGKLSSTGFDLDLITDEMTTYRMDFIIDTFS